MRAAFELYRAFERDAADNQEALRRNGKLAIPVLAAWGAIRNSGPLLREMMQEVADDVTGVEIAHDGRGALSEFPQTSIETSRRRARYRRSCEVEPSQRYSNRTRRVPRGRPVPTQRE
jgi:hypothetical protein